ncbi:glutathione S-transferase-like protein [Arabidopsis thaliana]|uniref:Isoform 2 of Glutathione S-transferase U9 n=1 Tax=Arabidopsis thaliana TaxID=3702 RepID=Q9FUT0-2|nr:glutathione S-transferase tau 9 [Arabidopsis thaliana]AAG30129.1 glutathione S-transferase [Arabidopsis thaliana]AED97613.1 glutathione S-transferase tau 9 [Arabidopsis thaliana]BAB11498.1 glutathione S-transferase-like protein [Arabidopsis thaliana]|eukprot:NP_568954.2 glutathione S-transferase tau 9 [Arabidopsis thaliana]
MDEEVENKVILHGSFASPYSKRIELALRLKSIPYQFVQEDLQNKSQTLLRYNPVHKKIPVLVHNEDPYRRSKVRFWANYIQLHLYDLVIKVVKSEGEEQKKALTEVKEKLSVIEKEGLKEIFSDTDGEPTVTNETMSLVDIVMCTLLSPYKAHEEVLGLKIIDPEIVPGVYGWINAINETSVVKDLSPPYEQILEILRAFRQMSLSPVLETYQS